MIRIECFISEGCLSRHQLESNIRAALEQEGLEAEVTFTVICEDEAKRLGIPGSPTVRIAGRDIESLQVLRGTVS